MLAIDAQNVKKWFGNRKKKHVAIAGLSLAVKQNQIFGLLGSNGAGKTTFLSILATTLLQNEGSVKIYGNDVVKDKLKIREIIGVCSGYSGLFDDLTARENLVYYAKLRKIKEVDARIDELLKLIELEKEKDTVARDLSTGMRQRVSIAVALVGKPKLLLLDEPTVGLDPVIATKVRESIKSIQRKLRMTIILTTHNMYEAEYLCKNIALIKNGNIITVKTVDGLRKMHGGHQIIEIETEKKVNRFRSPGVIEVVTKNKETTIKIDDVQKNLNTILSKLNKYGIKKISVRQPTLEELYLAFVK
jgi:ABC-2 type transport system ATP-binding protein